MKQPEGLQQELLKLSRPVRQYVLTLSAEIERLRGCVATANGMNAITYATMSEQIATCRALLRELLDNLDDGWLPELHSTDDWVKRAWAAVGEHE